MNLLQRLVQNIATAEHRAPQPIAQVFQTANQVESLPVDLAKAANRTMPWGQANQVRNNRPPTPVSRSQPNFLGQMTGTGAVQTMPQSSIQGAVNPGYTPLQTGSFINQTQNERPYDQQQIQVGPQYMSLSHLSGIGRPAQNINSGQIRQISNQPMSPLNRI